MPDLDPTQYRLNDLKLRWQQDPSSRLFLQLADEHRKLGQHQEAVAVLEQGLEHRPNDLSALVALGRCRLELERIDEAIEPLETVVSRDPTHIVASKLLIEAYLQLGDGEKAGERLRTYRLLNDRDPELNHLEYRLQRLQAEDEQEVPTVAGGELPGESVEEEESEVEASENATEAPSTDFEEIEIEATIPDVVELEAIEPEPTALEGLEPAAAEPETTEDGAAEPEAVELETAEPEAVEPDAVEPEMAEPEVAKPEAAESSSTMGGDPFLLASDPVASPDLGSLWEQLPEPAPAADEPFLGLVGLEAGRHWELLAEEGIFAAPDVPASSGATAPAEPEVAAELEAIVAESEELVEPEAVLVEPEEAPEVETAAIDEPETVDEPEEPVPFGKPEAVAPEAEPAAEAVAPEAEAVSEPETIAEPETGAEADFEPEAATFEQDAAEPAVDEEEPEAVELAAPVEEPAATTAATSVAGAVVAGVAAAGAAALAGLSGGRESNVEEEPASGRTTSADESPAAAEASEPVATDAPEPAATEPEATRADASELAEEPATATLGELYLKQGYRQEAERIFRQVLEQDPGNRVALENLARFEPQRTRPLSAADLLAVRIASGRIPEGLTAKKVLVLSNYSQHLRAAARIVAPESPGTDANGASPGTGASEATYVP